MTSHTITTPTALAWMGNTYATTNVPMLVLLDISQSCDSFSSYGGISIATAEPTTYAAVSAELWWFLTLPEIQKESLFQSNGIIFW